MNTPDLYYIAPEVYSGNLELASRSTTSVLRRRLAAKKPVLRKIVVTSRHQEDSRLHVSKHEDLNGNVACYQ